MEWFVYIAQTASGKYYTGITTSIEKRIEKHNKGKGAHLAITHGSFKLVYLPSGFKEKSQARKREIQIKGWSRVKKELLINKKWK